jgi:hypothetical protein
MWEQQPLDLMVDGGEASYALASLPICPDSKGCVCLLKVVLGYNIAPNSTCYESERQLQITFERPPYLMLC